MSSVVFLVNLIQDVNVIRPLTYLLSRETDHEIILLISQRFLERDDQKIWQRELAQIRADIGAEMGLYDTALDAFAVIRHRHGYLVAGSESNLPHHVETHEVFRIAPPGFLRVTLQHGFECVGFLQSREHIVAHSRNVTFAADVLCGWCDAPVLNTMPRSERSKLYVTGPSTILQRMGGEDSPSGTGGGLVCENLHSVRLRMAGGFGTSFMDDFFEFAAALGDYGLPLALRPHPAGQYTLKSKVELPGNVVINNLPIYRAGLATYQFGISPPSTIVLDMVLADVPTAVWHDSSDMMDYSNYDGLTDISTAQDWLAFARDAVLRRDAILSRQRAFLDRVAMPRDPQEVYRRFARLFNSGAMGPALVASAATAAPAQLAGSRPHSLEWASAYFRGDHGGIAIEENTP